MFDEFSNLASSVGASDASCWRISVVDHEGHWDQFGNHVGPCFYSKEVLNGHAVIPREEIRGVLSCGAVLLVGDRCQCPYLLDVITDEWFQCFGAVKPMKNDLAVGP